MIPSAAVESGVVESMRQLGLHSKELPEGLLDARRDSIRKILEAAAPHIVAAALREAADHLEYGNPIGSWLAERADELTDEA